MSEIIISKIKARRGTDTQRKSVVLDQGELAYATDTSRFFVGNGVLSGGGVVGSKVHPPITNEASLVNLNSQTGDLAYANNLFYQLTGSDYTVLSGWAPVGPKLDASFLEFDSSNNITISDDSITFNQISSEIIGDGLLITSGIVSIDGDASFEIVDGKLSLADDSVDENHITSNTFSGGLTGGSGDRVGVKIDNTLRVSGTNHLGVGVLGAGNIAFTSLDSDWFGAGLIYDAGNELISSEVTEVDATLSKDLSGVIGLPVGGGAKTVELSQVETDAFGRVVDITTSIFDCLTGDSSLNDTSPLSSIFNGSPDQSIGGIPSNITQFEAVSAYNGTSVVITLSSAGFITFEGGISARNDDKYVGRFAIPIFTY